MRLLVSVSTADEARAALEGGAGIIDAKDPHGGALGPVSLDTLAAIRDAVAGARLLTAALGDAVATDLEPLAQAYAAAGAGLVKVGFAATAGDAGALLAGAVRGAGRAGAGVVTVAYADADAGAAVTFDTVIDLAVAAGARGVLVDTTNKTGPGLTSLVQPGQLAAWVSRARHAGLWAAVAGRLSADDLLAVAASGADVAGVRGAACDEGRLGRVTAQRVATLAVLVAGTPSVFQGSP